MIVDWMNGKILEVKSILKNFNAVLALWCLCAIKLWWEINDIKSMTHEATLKSEKRAALDSGLPS